MLIPTLFVLVFIIVAPDVFLALPRWFVPDFVESKVWLVRDYPTRPWPR